MGRARKLILLCFIPVTVFAQGGIPNPGFEIWNGNTPNGWTTNNSGNYITLARVNDAHEGQYAVKGTVIQGQNSISQPPVLQSVSGNYGFPVDATFTEFSFWYKSFLYGGDRFNINVYLYNASLVVVGGGSMSISVSESNYTMMTIPVTQFTAGAAFAMLSFTIADGSGLTNGHIQSWFQVDELTSPFPLVQAVSGSSGSHPVVTMMDGGVKVSARKSGLYRVEEMTVTGQCLFEAEYEIHAGEEQIFALPNRQEQAGLIFLRILLDGEEAVSSRRLLH